MRPITYGYTPDKIDQAQGRLSMSLHVKFHLVYAMQRGRD